MNTCQRTALLSDLSRVYVLARLKPPMFAEMKSRELREHARRLGLRPVNNHRAAHRNRGATA